ncbi:glycosyltransferase [Amycolatopsis samaneae]|uniref:Glycosyltransferase n=1 Tax=Amycolatopsis samaneae TaxID=664691 RepID=A0ABW5GSZ1_9PSEU
MRFLLATIGSRGDVQPVLALAVRLTGLGQDVRMCAPPDFRGQVEGYGISFVPLGPELRATGKVSPSAAPPTPEQRRRMVADSVADQFAVIGAAAEDRDVLVQGGYLVTAAPTVAERRGIRYVMAAYCPIFLPSPRHAPPVFPGLGQKPADGTVDNRVLWDEDTRRWNDTWGDLLNAHRDGLAPVTDVRGHVFTERPWLAADPALAPWPEPGEGDVVQTGAWILPDERPLPPGVEEFLDAGEPPVYFGFGSVRAPEDLAATMVKAARALGRRAIVLRGWAGLTPPDDGPDCLSVGEINQQALFGRVAAVVHHGGAGTTTAATRAGAPQVVIPQHVDQHYFARRVGELGIGVAHAPGAPSADSLAEALGRALEPAVAARARAVAAEVRDDGALIAAQRLIDGK